MSSIATRVRHGGHDIPKEDVLRRFDRSWQNFLTDYRLHADSWTFYDNSGNQPVLQEQGP
jgi:predicted ABC-type ATPase